MLIDMVAASRGVHGNVDELANFLRRRERGGVRAVM